MDIWHRAGRIFRLSNLEILIFFLLHIGLLFIIFFPYGLTPETALPLISCYVATVLISLSPIGEWTLAVLSGAKEIKRKDIKIRLIPLYISPSDNECRIVKQIGQRRKKEHQWERAS